MKASKQLLIRFLGLSGVLGGIILLIGDQLLYWGPPENLSNISTFATGQIPIHTLGLMENWRHMLTGIAPLLTVWGYTLGSMVLFFALEPAGKKLALTCAGLFAAASMGVAIIHTLYYGIGISVKSAYLVGAGYEDAIDVVLLPATTFDAAVIINYLPGTLSFLLFAYAILFKQTLLPKWLLAFNPVILVNTQYIILPLLPNNLFKVALMGGYVNLSFSIFFALLTYLLWNKINSESESLLSNRDGVD